MQGSVLDFNPPPLPPRSKNNLEDDTDNLAPKFVEEQLRWSKPNVMGLELEPDFFLRLIGDANRPLHGQEILCAAILHGQYLLLGAESGLLVVDLAHRLDKVRIVQMLYDESFFQIECLESLNVMVALVGSRRSRTIRIYNLDSIMHLIKFETLWKDAKPVESTKKRTTFHFDDPTLNLQDMVNQRLDQQSNDNLPDRIKKSLKRISSRFTGHEDNDFYSEIKHSPTNISAKNPDFAEVATQALTSSWAHDYSILDIQNSPLSFEIHQISNHDKIIHYLAILSRYTIDLFETSKSSRDSPISLVDSDQRNCFHHVCDYWVPLEPKALTFVENASRFVISFGSRCGIVDARTKQVEEIKVNRIWEIGEESSSFNWLGCIILPDDALYPITSNENLNSSSGRYPTNLNLHLPMDNRYKDSHYRTSFDITRSNVQTQQAVQNLISSSDEDDNIKPIPQFNNRRRSLLPGMKLSMPRFNAETEEDLINKEIPMSAATDTTSASFNSMFIRGETTQMAVQDTRYLFTYGRYSYIISSLPKSGETSSLDSNTFYSQVNESSLTVTHSIDACDNCRIKWNRPPNKVSLLRTSVSIDQYLLKRIGLMKDKKAGCGLYIVAFHNDMIEWVTMEEVADVVKVINMNQSSGNRSKMDNDGLILSGVSKKVIQPKQHKSLEGIRHLFDRKWSDISKDAFEKSMMESCLSSFLWAQNDREGFLFMLGESEEGPQNLIKEANKRAAIALKNVRGRKKLDSSRRVRNVVSSEKVIDRVDRAFKRASLLPEEEPVKGGGRWRWLREKRLREIESGTQTDPGVI